MSFLYDVRLGKVVKSKLYSNGLLLKNLLNKDKAIKELFSGGKQGVWYDPSDKSTLFQDAAGTVPVTKDGDPVGLMLDKSGNGYHARQSFSTARATYRTNGSTHRLTFDGVDDWYIHNYHSEMAMGLVTGVVTPDNPSQSGALFTATKPGMRVSVMLYIPATDSRWGTYAGGWVLADNVMGSSVVLTYTINDAEQMSLYTDGQLITTKTGANSASSIQRQALGRERTTEDKYYFVGDFYGLIVTDSVFTDSERVTVNNFMREKMGITL